MSDEDPEGGGVAQAVDDGGATEKVVEHNITQEDIDETAKQLEDLTEHIKKPTTVESNVPTRPTFGDADHVEVDRTNLEAILDVTNRLKTKRSRKSTSILALASETYKDKQVNKIQ